VVDAEARARERSRRNEFEGPMSGERPATFGLTPSGRAAVTGGCAAHHDLARVLAAVVFAGSSFADDACEIALTRTPLGPNSAAHALVRVSTVLPAPCFTETADFISWRRTVSRLYEAVAF
jgi:hypothetical protein